MNVADKGPQLGDVHYGRILNKEVGVFQNSTLVSLSLNAIKSPLGSFSQV